MLLRRIEEARGGSCFFQVSLRRWVPVRQLPGAIWVAPEHGCDLAPVTLHPHERDQEAQLVNPFEAPKRDVDPAIAQLGPELVRHQRSVHRERVGKLEQVHG